MKKNNLKNIKLMEIFYLINFYILLLVWKFGAYTSRTSNACICHTFFNDKLIINQVDAFIPLMYKIMLLSYFIILLFFKSKIYSKILIYILSEIGFFNFFLKSYFDTLIDSGIYIFLGFHYFMIELGFFLFIVLSYFLILFLKIEIQNFLILDEIEKRKEKSIKSILKRISYFFIPLCIICFCDFLVYKISDYSFWQVFDFGFDFEIY
jgi:hypothetical protein